MSGPIRLSGAQGITGTYYMLDFGLVADGVHDDSASINSAIAFIVANGGGRLELPPNVNILVSSTIMLQSNMEFVIPSSTNIKASALLQGSILATAVGSFGILIDARGGGGLWGTGINVGLSGQYGLHVQSSSTTTVLGLYVTGCQGAGIVLEYASGVQLIDCVSTGNFYDGFRILNSNECAIIRAQAVNNSLLTAQSYDGLYMANTSHHCTIVAFDSNDNQGTHTQHYSVNEINTCHDNFFVGVTFQNSLAPSLTGANSRLLESGALPPTAPAGSVPYVISGPALSTDTGLVWNSVNKQLDISGRPGLKPIIVVATANYAVQATDDMILAEPGASPIRIALPHATGSGRPVTVVHYSTGGQQTNVGTQANETMNGFVDTGGNSGWAMLQKYSCETFIDVALNNWQILGHIGPISPMPNPTAGANNGGSPPAPGFIVNEINRCGVCQFGSGMSPSAGAQVNITWATDMVVAPVIVISEQNLVTKNLGLYVSTSSNSGFTVSSVNAPTASQSGTTYEFSWIARAYD